jgi:hypothetical protein
MSDELRLPDELAACEARLAALPLGASRIDRDQLMYRAGWAAAEAARGSAAAPTLVASETKRGTIVAWSGMSAALAASLAVAATLALQPRIDGLHEPAVAVIQPALAASPDEVAPGDTNRIAADRRLLAQLDALASGRSGVSDRTASALFTALGDRSEQRRSQPVLVSTSIANASDDGLSREPKTARGLLEEYLPGSSRRPYPVSPRSGEVLKLLNPLTWNEETI